MKKQEHNSNLSYLPRIQSFILRLYNNIYEPVATILYAPQFLHFVLIVCVDPS